MSHRDQELQREWRHPVVTLVMFFTGVILLLPGLCSLLFSGAPRGHEGRMPERLVAIVTTTELGAPLASEGPSGKIRHHPARLAATIAACERDLLLVKISLAKLARREVLDDADAAACQRAATRVFRTILEARYG